MASIIKKIKKGHPYYYAVQSARVDSKPRIVCQKYLGTIEAIVQRTDQAKPPKPKESIIFEAAGSVRDSFHLFEYLTECADFLLVVFSQPYIPDIIMPDIDDNRIRPCRNYRTKPAVTENRTLEKVDCRTVRCDRMEFRPLN